MRMFDIIKNKRDGKELTDEQIAYFITGYKDGDIPDYQASALLMAIYFKGMTEHETVTLTECMASSGDKVDLSRFGKLSCDKHSTGGVGDKTTPIIAPIVASLGGKVAKMSGRGLGHTGGTVDKLESIDGYRTSLSPDEFMAQAEKCGVAVIGQSGNLTPADKKLYALRDVTATIDIIPLIASSVMSKKLAAGAHSIVLDVKTGSGAFMKTADDGKKLAEQMVSIGKAHGRNVTAFITDMDMPLGNNIGNALEIIEAVEVLSGRGDRKLREICTALASEMISLAQNIEPEKAVAMVNEAIDSGKALEKFREWITAQGGKLSFDKNGGIILPLSKYKKEIYACRDGYIAHMDTENIGKTAMVLGAGRQKKEDSVDLGAGIILAAKTGDKVNNGDLLATFYSSEEAKLSEAEKLFRCAIELSDEKPHEKPLILDVVR